MTQPEPVCRCGHSAGAHDLTDGEPGPCYGTANRTDPYGDTLSMKENR
jgi:hypothetical protein